MQNDNELKADRMSQAGEWPEVDRRQSERRDAALRSAAQSSPCEAAPADTDALADAVQHLLGVAEISLDYRPEFRRAMSQVRLYLEQSRPAGAARQGGNTKPEPAVPASRAMVPVTDSLSKLTRYGFPDLYAGDSCTDLIEDKRGAYVLFEDVAALATPVAGWVSVENVLNDAKDALGTCVEFIKDAHILEGQWHWEPVQGAEKAIAAIESLAPVVTPNPTQQEPQ